MTSPSQAWTDFLQSAGQEIPADYVSAFLGETIRQSVISFEADSLLFSSSDGGTWDSVHLGTQSVNGVLSMSPESFPLGGKVLFEDSADLSVVKASLDKLLKADVIPIGVTSNLVESVVRIRSVRLALLGLNPSKRYRLLSIPTSAIRANAPAMLIHATLQALGGVLGGADAVSISSLAHHEPSDLRLAANIHRIIRHECGLERREDYWTGSFLVDELTTKVADLISTKWRDSHLGPTRQRSEDGCPGKPPFIRGPYVTMYTQRPWTIRQYAGFSTADESNAFYRRNLEQGQKGLSVAFDLPTHRGYDSDHPRVAGDVGMSGVAIDSVLDMERLFDGIPLDRMSVSMTMNGAVLPVLAFFIVAAERQGVPLKSLSGTIQNDILKEFMVRNTYIYPPRPSMRIVRDIIAFCSTEIPRFNPISVSGYHMQEAGATAEIELAYTIANGLEYVRAAIDSGLDVDSFAPRISFFFGIGMDLQTEVAKLRAARGLWATRMDKFKPKNPKSTMLRTHCQTSGWSLTAQDPLNNVCRTTIEAVAAVLGQTQSLHTNSLDEAIALPTDESARVARETQIILQQDSGLSNFIDLLGGSAIISERTSQLMEAAGNLIDEVEQAGGMEAAIEQGIPQRNIENAAAKRQALIDSGVEKLIGVNAYLSTDDASIPTLIIDNAAVRNVQLEQLEQLRTSRDQVKVSSALDELTKAARGDGNLLEKSIEAARLEATLGEISLALEDVFGRHRTTPGVRAGIYQSNTQAMHLEEARSLSNKFAKLAGRRPRILVAKLGQDGHDRGAKVVSSAFADMGFDVDIGPLFQTPAEVVKQAIENDVHVIGISTLAGAHTTLVPELIRLLGNTQFLVVVGGVIPPGQVSDLMDQGVAAVFGPGTPLTESAETVLKLLLDRAYG